MNIRNYRRRPKLAPKGSRQQDTPRLQPCRDEGRGVAASRPSSSQAPRDIEPKPCRALVNRGTPRLQTERGQILVPQRFTHSCFFIPGPIFAPLSPPPACTRGCRLPRRFLPARRLRIRAAEEQHCSGGKEMPQSSATRPPDPRERALLPTRAVSIPGAGKSTPVLSQTPAAWLREAPAAAFFTFPSRFSPPTRRFFHARI